MGYTENQFFYNSNPNNKKPIENTPESQYFKLGNTLEKYSSMLSNIESDTKTGKITDIECHVYPVRGEGYTIKPSESEYNNMVKLLKKYGWRNLYEKSGR